MPFSILSWMVPAAMLQQSGADRTRPSHALGRRGPSSQSRGRRVYAGNLATRLEIIMPVHNSSDDGTEDEVCANDDQGLGYSAGLEVGPLCEATKPARENERVDA